MAEPGSPPGELSGVLPVDKPEGPTSHDVVARARRALGTRRIGHSGTLDPFASGLLLLCIGRATRLAEYLVGLDKSYLARARLGVRTDSDDRTGTVIATSEAWRELSETRVEAAVRELVGPLLQTPPAYSAKKVAGERMYARARRGDAVELPPVPVTVHALRVLALEPPDLLLHIDCSSGTYVRALARDLGESLGVGAHLTDLRRTRIGAFELTSALPLADLDDAARVAAAWLEPARALPHLAGCEIGPAQAAEIGHGGPIGAPPDLTADGFVAVTRAGELVAVAELSHGMLRPRKVFL